MLLTSAWYAKEILKKEKYDLYLIGDLGGADGDWNIAVDYIREKDKKADIVLITGHIYNELTKKALEKEVPVMDKGKLADYLFDLNS